MSLDTIHYDEILGNAISKDNLVVLHSSNGVLHYFDIYTLVKAYTSTRKLENPFTREPLPLIIMERVMSYLKVDLVLPNESVISFNGATPIYEVILEVIFHLRGDIRLCVSSEVFANGVSLYAYALTDEISSLNLPSLSKVTLVTYTKPSNLRTLAFVLEKCEDTHKPLLATAIRKHLSYGEIVYHT